MPPYSRTGDQNLVEPWSGGARAELANALLALRLEVGPLLAAQLGLGLVGEPPLAADALLVARDVQLAEHGEHPGLHAPAHNLVDGQVLAANQVEELGARVG